MAPPFPSPLPLDGTGTPHNRHAPPKCPPHTSKCALTMSELFTASASSTLREVFCIGRAAIIIPLCASDGSTAAVEVKAVQGIVLPVVGGEDSIPHAPWEQLVDVQEGHVEKEGVCCVQLPTRNILEHPQFRHQHCVPMTLTLHPDNTDTAPR